jgi:lipopolysaccharide export system permease protein
MDKVLKLMDLIVNKGVGFGEVGALIVYLLPSLLVLTIPMSVLLAILIALGRFSADSEVVAMKASGISLYQMTPPFAVFCILGFLFTNVLTLSLLPKGNFAFREQLAGFAKKYASAGIEAGVFKDTFKDVVVYVNDYDRENNLIKGIFIYDKRDPKRPAEISGKEAKLFFGEDNANVLLRIFNGSLHNLNKDSGDYQYLLFKTYEMEIGLNGSEKKRRISKRELGILELIKRSKEKDASAKIGIEIQQRLAFPFACIVFGILGLSLGVYWRRGGKAYGFVLSILVVFFYYILLSFGENLAKNEHVSSFVGIWLPNVVFTVFGVLLYRKSAREEPFFFQKELQNKKLELFELIKKKLEKRAKKLKEPETLIPVSYDRAVHRKSMSEPVKRKEEKPANNEVSPIKAVFRGNIVSEKFHKPGCIYYKSNSNTEYFENRDAAIEAGFKPCKNCNP